MDDATDPMHSGTVCPSLFSNPSSLWLSVLMLLESVLWLCLSRNTRTDCFWPSVPASFFTTPQPTRQHFCPFDLWPPQAPIRGNWFLNDFCTSFADNAQYNLTFGAMYIWKSKVQMAFSPKAREKVLTRQNSPEASERVIQIIIQIKTTHPLHLCEYRPDIFLLALSCSNLKSDGRR